MQFRPRILVVDDEPKICRLLEQLLEREGYSVTTCPDGAAALKAIVRSRPDLVITDLKMPGMDGLELASLARSLDPDLPVVLVTGYASMETAVKALREGISDYVTKPFSLAEIKSVVGRILQNRALAEENRRLVAELRVANAELSQHRRRLTLKVREAEDDLVAANRALGRRLREMEVIHEINQMIAGEFDEGELLALATQLVRDKVGADAVAVFLDDASAPGLVAHGVRGDVPGLADGDRIAASEGLVGHVLSAGDALLVPAVRDDPRPSPAERQAFGEGSVLALPIRAKGRPAGVLVVGRSSTTESLGAEERGLLEVIANDLSVAIENSRLFTENEQNYIDILAALVQSMEARDPYLHSHSRRVSEYAAAIGNALNLPPARQEVLEIGAGLHDLGKVGIPDEILRKEGPLTPDDWVLMRSHPEIGDRIVKPLGKLRDAKPIIRNHHERWDGSGYPDGLAGEEIPLLTRIVAVADAFDALTTDRSYRPARTIETALTVIEEATGTYFCPLVAPVFLELRRS